MANKVGADVVSIFSEEDRIARAEEILAQLKTHPVHYILGQVRSGEHYTEEHHVLNLQNAAFAYARTGFLSSEGERHPTGLDMKVLQNLAEVHNSGMYSYRPEPCADPQIRIKHEQEGVQYLAELIGDEEGEELIKLWQQVYVTPTPEGALIRHLDLLDDYARSIDLRRKGVMVSDLHSFTREQSEHVFFGQVVEVLRENRFPTVPSYTQLHVMLQCKKQGELHIEVDEGLFDMCMGVAGRNLSS